MNKLIVLAISIVIGIAIILLSVGLTVGFGSSSDAVESVVVEPEVEASIPMPLNLTILHVNDHHSHLREDDFDIDGSVVNIEEIKVFYGGYPRLVTAFQEMESSATSDGGNVLKLHAGDALTGTSMYSLFKSKPDVDMMQKVCFDAFALGNHEFDDGDGALAEFIIDLQDDSSCPNTPVLSANVVPGSDSPLVPLSENGSLSSNTIKTMENGEKVGIIGINIQNKTMFSSSPSEGTILLDEVETAIAQIEELTLAGVNKIVLLTHIGLNYDISWMADIDGVDVVVGGDSHSLLGEAESLSSVGFPTGPYPTAITKSNGDTVCVVTAWEYAHGIGKVDIQFDEEGKVLSCGGDTIIPFDPIKFEPELNATEADTIVSYIESLGSNYMKAVEDADALAALQVYIDQSEEQLSTVIASVPEDICFERIPGQGRSKICPIEATSTQGGGVCNLVAKAFMSQTPTSDFAIQNAGGCRTDIPKGNFTYDSAYTLLPFANTLVTLPMSGSQIKQVLEEALENALTGSTGAYPYASGLRYDVNLDEPFGNRISGLEMNSRLELDWSDIVLDDVYTVVTNSFVSAGRDGYFTFGEIVLQMDTYKEYAQSFVDYAEDVKVLENLPLSEYSTKSFIPKTD